MRIIPAIDVIDGKAVRLEKGNFAKKKIYADHPLEVAKMFEDSGIEYLHLVDLDGAKIGAVKNQKILEDIKTNTNLIVDYGGGIRNLKDIESLFNSGADQINIGSLSIQNPELMYSFLETFDTKKIILSPDVLQMKIVVNGWQESSEIHIFDYIQNYIQRGIEYYVCTDIEKDGMLTGSSINLYKAILSDFPKLKLIASGGVADIEEIAILKDAGLNGVIIGKAIYEGRISLKQLLPYVN